MAMSRLHILLPLAFILALGFAEVSLCSDSPSSSPSPAPADTPSAPSPSADTSSPPSPPSYSPTPAPSPANTASNSSSPKPPPASSPAPAPGVNGISHAGVADVEAEPEPSSGGMSAGKKAGIAIGVIACVSFVVFGAMLYKKRQHNIRRSQYSSAARREFLSDL